MALDVMLSDGFDALYDNLDHKFDAITSRCVALWYLWTKVGQLKDYRLKSLKLQIDKPYLIIVSGS